MLPPAIHREQPHPVRPRYECHKTCGSRRAIVQLDNIVILFYFARAREFTRISAHEPARPPASIFLSTVRDELARVRASRSRGAQFFLCLPENLVSRDGSCGALSVPYKILSTRGN